MNKERIGPDSTDASRISAREKGVYGVVANQSHMSEKNKHEQRLLKKLRKKNAKTRYYDMSGNAQRNERKIEKKKWSCLVRMTVEKNTKMTENVKGIR